MTKTIAQFPTTTVTTKGIGGQVAVMGYRPLKVPVGSRLENRTFWDMWILHNELRMMENQAAVDSLVNTLYEELLG